jgi:hypothetical protein
MNSAAGALARGTCVRSPVMRLAWSVVVTSLVLASPARAADLPPHGPLRVLVVSDSVNPNGLSDAELTQAGDLSAALSGPNTGLEIDSVLEVDSQCVDDALAALADPTTTTLIYFAHKSAHGCDNSDQQPALTLAVEDFLIQGGGVVVFHHGIYQDAGKQPILQLLGGSAGSIGWDTNTGQNIINVADGHFVTSNGVEYTDMVMYADPQHGVPAALYPYFNNVPDERYPALDLLTSPGETRTLLFASDYASNGGQHVLGYDLQRAGWIGRVVFYQPAEYQPHALDDVDGNNFQVLANALVHVSPAGEPPGETTGTDTDEPGTTSSSATTDGETGTPGTTAPGETGGGPGDPTNEPTSAGETANGELGSGEAATGGDEETANGEVDPGESATAVSSPTATGGESMDDGCGCRSSGAPGLMTFVLLGLRRRRR